MVWLSGCGLLACVWLRSCLLLGKFPLFGVSFDIVAPLGVFQSVKFEARHVYDSSSRVVINTLSLCSCLQLPSRGAGLHTHLQPQRQINGLTLQPL